MVKQAVPLRGPNIVSMILEPPLRFYLDCAAQQL